MNSNIDTARIDELLVRYYDATATQSEELELYALLLDVKDEHNPYYADALIVRSAFEHADDTEISDGDHQLIGRLYRTRSIPSFFVRYKYYLRGIVASIVFIAATLMWYQAHQEQRLLADSSISWRNGESMTQEEVNAELKESIHLLKTTLRHAKQTQATAMDLLTETLKKHNQINK